MVSGKGLDDINGWMQFNPVNNYRAPVSYILPNSSRYHSVNDLTSSATADEPNDLRKGVRQTIWAGAKSIEGNSVLHRSIGVAIVLRGVCDNLISTGCNRPMDSSINKSISKPFLVRRKYSEGIILPAKMKVFSTSCITKFSNNAPDCGPLRR